MKFYQNLSISNKITLILVGSMATILIIVGYLFYQSMSTEVEFMLGKRLEGIARTASLQISGSNHNKLLSKYLEQLPDLEKTIEFKTIQKKLKEIKKVNNLKSDLYTVIAPDWAEGNMIFMAMSNTKTYIGNSMAVTKKIKDVFKNKKSSYSKIYYDKEGSWVSAYAPIIENNKVVAVIEVDYHADEEVLAAKKKIFYLIGYPALGAIIFCFILGEFFGLTLSLPIRKLQEFSMKITNGDWDGAMQDCIVNTSKDEIGRLTNNYNDMLRHLKVAKDELTDYSIQLENKVIETKAAEETAKEALEVKAQFLSNMSHELRTPLNGLIGASSLMNSTKLDDEQEDLVKTLLVCGDSLSQIINDILDISKIESGEFVVESNCFSIQSVVDQVFTISNTLTLKNSNHFKVTISNNAPKYILSDHFRVKQILLNLLSNSFKFTKEGLVELVIDMAIVDDKEFVRFRVTDEGIGIPLNRQKNIFEKFTQADNSTTRLFGGTGLGLNISKELSNLLGGHMELESDGETGSTFILHVGYIKPSDHLIEKFIETEKSKTTLITKTDFAKRYPLKILLVEDNLINQKIAVKFLNKLGLSAKIANHGKEAVDICKEEMFDLILMDLQMPIMGGIEAAISIRKDSLNMNTYMLTLSANTDEKTKILCENAGMNAFIAKPFRVDEMVVIIEENFEVGKSAA